MRKIHSENKIVLCRWCQDPMPPIKSERDLVCSAPCGASYERHLADKSEAITRHEAIEVYTNIAFLGLCKGQGIRPINFSALIYSGYELVAVAVFDRRDLEDIGLREMSAYDAWRAPISKPISGDSVERYDPITMRGQGILSYLSERDANTEQKIARAIGIIADIEDMSPIDLFNTL